MRHMSCTEANKCHWLHSDFFVSFCVIFRLAAGVSAAWTSAVAQPDQNIEGVKILRGQIFFLSG